jgi:branched-chain amino acid transport system substrate-binding protein
VPYPITSTDFLPVLTKANENDPDAIILVAADTACAPAMKTAKDLGITATMYLVGSCAAPTIAEEIGEDAVAGRIFNVEGPITGTDVDTKVYAAALAKYGDPDLPLASAGTVSFRNIMNLWSLMKQVGGAEVSKETLLATVRAARDHPSFGGHPYTCDGRQVPNLPALCSPQQILVVHEDGALKQLTDWIDVPALLAQ